MAVTDFKITSDDLTVVDGDFSTTSASIPDADVQHITDILRFFKGELKENPYIGVGINLEQNASGESFFLLRNEITKQLTADNYNIISYGDSLLNDNGEININAERNE